MNEMARFGSPLWLADADRFRSNLLAFDAVWRKRWGRARIAYSYKTNRLPAFLQAAAQCGASAEVVCEAEYDLATATIRCDPRSVVVDGPAKPDRLLARAGAGGALVLADSVAELRRAARLGVRRIGLRVAIDSFTGAHTRFGIAPGEIPRAAGAAAALGLRVRVLSTHLVSTDFDPESRRVVVSWPRPAGEHARAARVLARLAAELATAGHCVEELDLGGGFPGPAGLERHAVAVSAALRDAGYAGGLLLEPGRAIVADAVDLAFSVVAVKRLADGTRCLVCDAGTNFLPGAAWSPPHLEAPGRGGVLRPALVTGPLCLNVDVLHPRAELPALRPGDTLVARAVGAYQQSAATVFGERQPAVLVCRGGLWEAPGSEQEYERHAA
jgi:diaminopimelate decarboxylase